MRVRVAVASLAVLLAGVVPASAAATATVDDPKGDVTSEGSPALMTAAQTRAVDIDRADAAMGPDSLAVSLTVSGQLADRRVDEESGTFVLFWQGPDPIDPEALWVFGLLDTGPEYIALWDHPEGSGFEESCAAWTASESGSVASYEIAYTCLPGARLDRDLHWAVAAGTGDNSGNSWSDFAPDEGDQGVPNSGPALTFPEGANTERPVPTARDIADTCDGRAPQREFDDTSGNPHEVAIDCISHYGITQGTGGDSYSPAFPLSKGQTATFLVRTLDVAGVTVAEAGDACDDTGSHAESLERLVASGVLVAPEDLACGEIDAISRAEMARWVERALSLGGVNSSEITDWYVDDEDSPDQPAINEITSLGIVTGAGQARFLPDATLSRAQMATFLARTLDALFDAQTA